MTYDMMHMSL